MSTRSDRLQRRRTRWRRTLSRAVALGAVVTIGVAGSYATFTTASNVDQAAISSSAVLLSIPSPGASNRLTLGALAIVPGDTLERVVDVVNSGSDAFGAITMTAAATTSSLLDT